MSIETNYQKVVFTTQHPNPNIKKDQKFTALVIKNNDLQNTLKEKSSWSLSDKYVGVEGTYVMSEKANSIYSSYMKIEWYYNAKNGNNRFSYIVDKHLTNQEFKEDKTTKPFIQALKKNI